MTLLDKPWFQTVLGFLLIAGLALMWTRCDTRPPLSRKAEKAVRATITRDQQQVGRDTIRARAATASAATSYDAGRAYATVATTIHQQAKAHATPTPVSDSAAKRLQRYLSNY